MQQQRFDFLLQMHGSGILTNPLLMTFGASRNAGFYRHGEYCPDPRHFMCWNEQQHEVVRNVQLMEYLGVPAQGEDLEFPLTQSDYRALLHSHDDLPAPGSYVCLHPGAQMPSRRWPVQRFAELADRLNAAGLPIVLTGSTQELGLSRSVAQAMQTSALNLTGKTDIGAFAALIAQARLLVCNDTGIVQIAAALKTPSVAVCCGSDPRRWMPLNWRRHRTVRGEASCRPCTHSTCPIGHPCALQVTPDAVLMVIRHLLVDNPRSQMPSSLQKRPRLRLTDGRNVEAGMPFA
jgi:ADP-heptose:LPS heptosyltransferase